jgi:hypothetical protein
MGFTVESLDSMKEMRRTLELWAQVMEPFDFLMIYITAHGGKDYVILGGEKLTVKEFPQLFAEFDDRVHIGIIIDSSFSGGFISDDIKEIASFIITSTSRDGYAFGDWDPENDVNPGDRGSEFTSGLVDSLAAQFPESGDQPLAPKDVYGRIFGEVGEVLMDVFEGAKEKDAAHQNGYSTPQIWVREREEVPGEEGVHGGYQ